MRRTELVKHCLRNKNARRRGLGIEIALLVLLAAVALSALLVSTAMLERNNLRDSETVTLERLALDQIGEDFLAGKITADGEYRGYIVEPYGEKNLRVFLESDGIRLLKLDVLTNGGKVAGWTYHNLGIGG